LASIVHIEARARVHKSLPTVKSPSIQNPRNVDQSSRLSGERRTALKTRFRWLPSLAILLCCVIYAAHFFFGGGASHLILDSYAYLQLANGQQTSVPFNSRIAVPFLASLISSATGLSTSAAFKLLTPAELLATLFVLRGIIRRRGGSPEWQATVLLAFGCSLAVTFGYTPILVDPMLLLLTCLAIAALDSGYLFAALGLICVAALTKEYGLVLGLVWLFHASRRGLRKIAYLGFILPVAALLIVGFLRQSSAGVGFGGWQAFAYHLIFEYQLSVLRLRGPGDYARLVYMWSWCGLWPAFFISAFSLLYRLKRQIKITDDQVGFVLLLLTLPILLLGDWSRNLIVVVPFSCAVATAHPLARDRYFTLLLASGGLATALARPFHSDPQPAQIFSMTMTIVSVISSLLIGIEILRFVFSKSSPRIEPGLDKPATDFAVQ
jgi:hypothetical membrane protein